MVDVEVGKMDIHVERAWSVFSDHYIKIAAASGRPAFVVEPDSELGAAVARRSNDDAEDDQHKDWSRESTQSVVAPDRATA